MATDPPPEQAEDEDAPLVALGRPRADAVRRLQIGFAGLFTMILLVSLANIIRNRAQESEDSTVPDVAANTQAGATAPNKDPLSDAGVVPELPGEATATPAAGAQGGNAAAQP